MRLLDRFASRAVDASAFTLGEDLFSAKTDAGVKVDHDAALKLTSVYACITLISDAVASMPVDLYRKTAGRREEVSRRPMWLESPNSEQSWREFADRVMHSLLTHGNAFVAITARDVVGRPEELWVVHPDEIVVRRNGQSKEFVWNGGEKVFTHYTARRPSGNMLHIMGHSGDGVVGLSPIDQARQTIGLGLATEKFGAKFFGNGSQVSGVVELPAGANPTQEQLDAWGAMWRRRYSGIDNAWKPVVLGNGGVWKPITLPNDQAQFIESRKFSVAEIARLYRVPPHLIGDVERSTSWGTGIEQQGIGFVTYTLNPWITRLEDSLSQLTPQNEYVKFNVNGLLRGDTQSRFAAYQTAIQNGFMTRNEARLLEDKEPIDGLDAVLRPLNVTEADRPDTSIVTNVVGQLIRAGYTPESSVAAATSGDFSVLVHTGLLPVTVKDEDL